MKDWIVRVFFPDYYEPHECNTCIELRKQLSIKNDEVKILLDHIINLTTPVLQIAQVPQTENIQPISTNSRKPWHIIKRDLERESRELAAEAKKASAEIPPVEEVKLMTEDQVKKLESEVTVG